jgi:hypothetical protein
VLLGSLVVAQFFISLEICALTMLFATIGALLVAIARPWEIWLSIRRGAKGILCAVGVVGAAIAYPLYMLYRGPYHFVGPPTPGGEGADLLNPVLPTNFQLVSLGHLGVIGSNLVFGNTSENGGYLGLPLLLLMAMIVLAYRKRPLVRLSALLVVIAFVLSLGNHLDIDNHRTSFPLPFNLVQWRPIFEDIVQVRIGLFVVLFAAVLVALGIDELHRRQTARGEQATTNRELEQLEGSSPDGDRRWVEYGFAPWVEPTYRRLFAPWVEPTFRFVVRAVKPTYRVLKRGFRPVLLVLGALAVVTLIPNVPLPTSPAGVPAYFSSPAVGHVPPGSVALISPYPSVFDPVPQVWQAVTGDRFSIIGGYALFASGVGRYPVPYPPPLEPLDVQMFLTGEADGAPFLSGPIPTVSVRLECDFRTFLARNQVGTVIDGPIPDSFQGHPKTIELLFRRALGEPSMVQGSVQLWYGVQSRIETDGPSLPCR